MPSKAYKSRKRKYKKRKRKYKNEYNFLISALNGDLLKLESCINSNVDLEVTNNNNGNTALMYASWKGYDTIVKKLIENKVNVNAINCNGASALILAVWFVHEKIVKQLIKAKADLNIVDLDTWSALTLAISEGHNTIAWMLINAGADLKCANSMIIRPPGGMLVINYPEKEEKEEKEEL